MSAIDEMSPYELACGLMRGDRVDMQRGYRAEAAASVAAERAGWLERRAESIPTPTADEEADKFWELLAFCQGFENGMAEAIEAADPATRFARRPEPNSFGIESFHEGARAGRQETGFLLYPTLDIAS